MKENKFTSRQFILTLLFIVFLSAYIWTNPNDVSESMQMKLMLIDASVLVMFCFNDIAKKIIELVPMFKGAFNKEAPNE